jgi:hypothetical protein
MKRLQARGRAGRGKDVSDESATGECGGIELGARRPFMPLGRRALLIASDGALGDQRSPAKAHPAEVLPAFQSVIERNPVSRWDGDAR